MNIQLLMSSISYLREFVFVTVILTLVLTFIFYYQSRHYTYSDSKKHFLGIFFELDHLSMLRMIFFFLNYCFIVSLVIRFAPMYFVHIYCFLALTLLMIIFNIKHKFVVYIGLNQVLIGALLFVLNILVNYLTNIRFTMQFFVVYVVSSLLLVFYCTYILFNELENVSKGRVKNEK